MELKKTSANRRPLDWSAVRGPKIIFALFVATAGGAGLSPWAPGTMGALVGIPIAYFTRDWDIGPRLALWIGILIVGTWAAEIFDQAMKSQDNQNIVIDEVLGMGITAWTLTTASGSGSSVTAWIVAFILFRLFDVWKPFPIRLLDRWSHEANQEKWHVKYVTGFGVMADDMLAGIYGLIVMIILQHFLLLK